MRRNGIGGEDDEEQEGDGDDGLHGQHVGAQRRRQVAPNSATAAAEQGEDQHPQQHRAFVVPPHAGDLVEQRLGRMRVGPHVLDREIRRDVGVHERDEGDRRAARAARARRARPTPIRRASPVRAPQAGSAICTSATASARMRAKCPSSTIMGLIPVRRHSPPPCGAGLAWGAPGRPGADMSVRSRRHRHSPHPPSRGGEFCAARLAPYRSFRHRALGLAVLPDALLLEGLGDFGGHVVLVVLGEHGVGEEAARRHRAAFGHHALALAEEVGKNAGVADGNGLGGVGDGELTVVPAPRLTLPSATRPPRRMRLPGGMCFSDHVLGRVEEDDGVAQRKEHEKDGDARGCRHSGR